MTGIVVVSHSRPLAEAAVDLARQMIRDGGPRIEIAAGVEVPGQKGPGIGTDATAIIRAIETASDDQGVVVLMDLGSAILSTETALELIGTGATGTVRLSAAPLVEGLVGAVVSAASGADPETVAASAEVAIDAKQAQLGREPAEG